MEIKVKFNNKISEPSYKATDFAIRTRTKKDQKWYSLEFTVCKSMGVSKVYSFDNDDKQLLDTLLERIKAKGEFIFDEGCKCCEKTAVDFNKYQELIKGSGDNPIKFGCKDNYVIIV